MDPRGKEDKGAENLRELTRQTRGGCRIWHQQMSYSIEGSQKPDITEKQRTGDTMEPHNNKIEYNKLQYRAGTNEQRCNKC